MPNYVPIQDLTSKNLADTDLIPVSDGVSAYGVPATQFKTYTTAEAQAAAEAAAAAAAQAAEAAASIAVDPTLSVSGKAADAKVTGNINANLEKFTGNAEIQFSDPSLKQYINLSGTTVQWDTPSVSSSTNIKWAVVECSPGDKFTINGRGGNSDRLWAFANSSKTILDKAAASTTANNLVLTAPDNAAYLIINDETNKSSYVGEIVADAVEKLSAKSDYSYYDLSLFGNGSTLVSQYIKIREGNTYKVCVLNPDYVFSGSSSSARFQIDTYPGGTAHTIFVAVSAVEPEYVFTADDDDARISVHADVGQVVLINVEDITEPTENATMNDKDIKAWFVEGFSAQRTDTGMLVSWSRLYIKYRRGSVDVSSDQSFTLTNAQPYVIFGNGEFLQRSTYASIGLDDVLMVQYVNPEIVGGLLYPYYVNYKETMAYADDSALNTFRLGHQLGQLKWTPKAQVKAKEGTHPANVEVTGVPYSSVKEYMKYVGIDVSLHTFMTAVNDIHSLLYTEGTQYNDSRSAYGRTYYGVNCLCYFGTVCSGFATTCYGSKVQYNSWEYQTFKDQFDVLENQDVRNLRIGDILSEPGHCAIVTAIERGTDGHVMIIEVDEQIAPIRLLRYTLKQLENRVNGYHGIWCRYKYLDRNTKYHASPFVLLPNEYVYQNGEFVYVDGDSSRTFYRAKRQNSASTLSLDDWELISPWESGKTYDPNHLYASYGEDVYYCYTTHTSGVSFDPSKWKRITHVYEWTPYPYVYNDDIVTFAGDRAAFRTNDLIYLNYIKGSYTSMQIYKDGTLIQNLALPSSGYQINVSSYCAGAGFYKARLTNGANHSRYTYFEVIDTQVSASYSNGKATINFSSANGKPIDVQICEQSGFPVCHIVPTEKDIENGSIVINPAAALYAQQHINMSHFASSTNIYARVVFEGEYGNAVNQMISLGSMPPIDGRLIYPDKANDLGTLTSATNVILAERLIDRNYTFSFTAGSGGSVAILSATDNIRWANALPGTLVNGRTYLVTVQNGIGSAISVG